MSVAGMKKRKIVKSSFYLFKKLYIKVKNSGGNPFGKHESCVGKVPHFFLNVMKKYLTNR